MAGTFLTFIETKTQEKIFYLLKPDMAWIRPDSCESFVPFAHLDYVYDTIFSIFGQDTILWNNNPHPNIRPVTFPPEASPTQQSRPTGSSSSSPLPTM
ncbi:MAG TPA: hypothetical protein VJ436_11015 [Anaerolineales bacterium]|nr:hypothetical protein [Anaerolineales bacterium]